MTSGLKIHVSPVRFRLCPLETDKSDGPKRPTPPNIAPTDTALPCGRHCGNTDEGIPCPPTPIGPGSDVVIKHKRDWLRGRCLAATSQICIVEVQSSARGPRFKPTTLIDPADLSDSTAWPPIIPAYFPLTPHTRGYYKHFHGKVRWVCGKKSPREAYRTYLRMVQRLERDSGTAIREGQHLALTWDRVFVPATAPTSVVAAAAAYSVDRAAHAPTSARPRSISSVAGALSLNEASPRRWCVYFLCLMGQVVYVGQTREIRSRLSDHRRFKRFDAVYFLPCKGHRAEKIEGRYIRRLRPVYNISQNPDTWERNAPATPARSEAPCR